MDVSELKPIRKWREDIGVADGYIRDRACWAT